MADNQSTRPPCITVGVLLEGLTWAELRAFVHLCRDVPDNESVGITFDQDRFERIGLEELVPLPAVMPDGT